MGEFLTRFKKALAGELDLTSPHLFRNLIIFTLPIVLLSALQIVYTQADQLVVNYFGGGYRSFVAVSSNTTLISLLIGLFLGVSVGANIVIAKAKGQNDAEKAERALHAAIVLAVVSGIVAGVAGFFLSPVLLTLMNVSEEVIPLATIYLRIYFVGLPFLMVFNFGSSALRALGDSKRPLYVLIICGLLNVGLNFLFVVPLDLDVAGVGFATIISELFQASLVILFLFRNKNGFIRLQFKKIFKLYFAEIGEILKTGIPAGLQSLVFTFSNLFVQTSINKYGLAAMAGNSASSQAEAFIYMTMNGFSVAVVSITAQNKGANNLKNLKRVLWYALGTVTVLGLVLGGLFVLLRDPIISIFLNERSVDTPEQLTAAKEYGIHRLTIVCITYFLCGTMDSEAAYCRGLGHHLIPTIISLFGACILRIVFIETLYRFVPYFHTIEWIWLTWTLSWAITNALYWCVIPYYRKKAIQEILSLPSNS